MRIKQSFALDLGSTSTLPYVSIGLVRITITAHYTCIRLRTDLDLARGDGNSILNPLNKLYRPSPSATDGTARYTKRRVHGLEVNETGANRQHSTAF